MMQITLDPAPKPETLQIIGHGLRQHNEAFASADEDSSFAVLLWDENGRILGGLLAKAGRGWLKIGSLWVDERVRGQGYGKQLMKTAETEGIQRGCHSAYLDTFSFQTPSFYEQCGYEVFGVLEAFPEPHRRFFMHKLLQQKGRNIN